MPSTHLRRVGLFLTAVFQLLLPTVVSVADARAEAAAERGAAAHIEAHSTPSCVPVHSADCAICRVLAGGATVARAPAVKILATRLIKASTPHDARVAISTLGQRAPSQRAPPVV
jgi:hypothetical protein